MRHALLCVPALALLLTGCGQPRMQPVDAKHAEATLAALHADTITALGGSDGALNVALAERVIATRVKPAGMAPFYVRGPTGELGSCVLPATQAAEVIRVLCTPGNLSTAGKKSCIPQVGIVMRFERGDSATEIAFCLSCAMLFVEAQEGRPAGWAHFDGHEPALRAVVMTTFGDVFGKKQPG